MTDLTNSMDTAGSSFLQDGGIIAETRHFGPVNAPKVKKMLTEYSNLRIFACSPRSAWGLR